MDPGLAEVMTRAVERTGQEPEAWYHGGSHGWALSLPQGVSLIVTELNSTPTEASGYIQSRSECRRETRFRCLLCFLTRVQLPHMTLWAWGRTRHSRARPYLEISLKELHTHSMLLT